MQEAIEIIKRDGRREPLNLNKIHTVIENAVYGLDNVSASELELKSHLQFSDGIKSEDIQAVLIKTAADLISEESPDYQFVAARLAMFDLRKRVYGDFSPIAFREYVHQMVDNGHYDPDVLTYFSDDELDHIDTLIDHERDFTFSYVAVNQLKSKYLLQNRVTGVVYETPQMLYMMVSMILFHRYPADVRMGYIKRFYDACSYHKISLPTPIMSGVRSITRQFSSCVVIEADDSLDSINRASSAIVKYVSQRAGIGINAGRIRALGSAIRNGEAFHTGCIPFFKHFQTAVKSCSQGGVRGGAATLFYPLWHLEAENLLVLKNNRGVEENRVRHIDYGVQVNGYLYQRLIKGDSVTFFSPHDVPGLYEAFFADQALFKALYEDAERNPKIRKKRMKAVEIFSLLASERASTGRIYIQHVDHCNTHSAFDPQKAPVRQSNLCMEIALPTKPVDDENHDAGEIALCTLAAFNLSALKSLDELYELADLLVRALDELLDYQDYPVHEARENTLRRRPLGVGVTSFAHYLAKHGVKYSDPAARAIVHELFETFQHALLTASCQLAKEKGACDAFDDTSYAQGLLPIDTYKRDLDDITPNVLKRDWEKTRNDIKQYGLRNSTLSALMPSETSSQITNSTNGIEPPISLISTKSSKDGAVKQVVPEYALLKDQYETRWALPDNNGYLELAAIMQKFIDQSISTNTHYDPAKFENGKVPVKIILRDMMKAYKLGIKTLYYHNTRDRAGMEDDDGCESGACKI